MNLPKVDGYTVLETVKFDDKLCTIPIVVLTGSEAIVDVNVCYKHKANAYLVKPNTPERLSLLIDTIENFWFVLGRVPSV